MSRKIEPVNDQVVVRRVDPTQVTAGGIVLPTTAQESKSEGEVIAVGPGRVTDSGLRIEPCVKPGDHVVYQKYAGTGLEVNGDEFVVIRENDVLVRLVTG